MMDLREISWGSMNWIDLAQDKDRWRALMCMVMNLRIPKNAGNFLSSSTTGGLSRRIQFHGVTYLFQPVRDHFGRHTLIGSSLIIITFTLYYTVFFFKFIINGSAIVSVTYENE
jgi:hypothetical protein